jgi:hypothetical protein
MEICDGIIIPSLGYTKVVELNTTLTEIGHGPDTVSDSEAASETTGWHLAAATRHTERIKPIGN